MSLSVLHRRERHPGQIWLSEALPARRPNDCGAGRNQAASRSSARELDPDPDIQPVPRSIGSQRGGAKIPGKRKAGAVSKRQAGVTGWTSQLAGDDRDVGLEWPNVESEQLHDLIDRGIIEPALLQFRHDLREVDGVDRGRLRVRFDLVGAGLLVDDGKHG